ncbi:MAG: hypothetical protein R6T92_10260 [Desulfosalsimonadaceae bacterium]
MTEDRILGAKAYRQKLIEDIDLETSTDETVNSETDRNKYIQVMENKVKKVKSMMDEMAQKSKSLEKDAKSEFDKKNEKVKQQYAEAKSKLDDIRESSEENWHKFKDDASNAWRRLAEGVKNAVNSFR